MKACELRQKYINFFKGKGHAVIKSAPLVPENDPTVLFTTAGMHPLVPFLLGEKHPLGKRLVNFQKCIRTGDIEEVGDSVHLTFFEMLGNWSLGDYFKKEAIEYSFEFLTSPEWLGLSPDKLAVTVFAGDNDAPFDDDAKNCWLKLGMPERRIAERPKKDNWWGPAGETGPCGPDTEMFFWNGTTPPPSVFNPDDKNWVEIWNNVFMQYNKTKDGDYPPLSQKNVDTGMGVERVTAILQGRPSCYDTELFEPVIQRLREISAKPPSNDPEQIRAERIIADHLRAAVFIMADGILPGNVDQPYVLRRLIRRSVMQARKLEIGYLFSAKIAKTIVSAYSGAYPELSKKSAKIEEEMTAEEEQFHRTIEKGSKEFEKFISRVPAHIEKKVISGKNAFFLYETYGFPVEITMEMASEKGFSVDMAGYMEAYRKHQELSRQGAEQKFKGGLADNSEKTTNLHTATHLLHEALRRVLGKHVEQKGSNITAERLRFDFSHPEKMTDEQLIEVQRIVNEVIEKKMSVLIESKTVEEALEEGAIGLFAEKYGEKVKIYSVGDFSKEICGGPHVENTETLGRFKILKEESSSRGVRRIKAVLE
jgi:alanyl-tRNA synthetase